MNEQDKIELSEKVVDELWADINRSISIQPKNEFIRITLFLKVSKSALTKIQELNENLPDPIADVLTCTCHKTFGPPAKDPGHICGVCYKRCCNFCIVDDFEICPVCTSTGKSKITCKDSNGAIFQSGDILRNKDSLTTSVKILQINETHVIFSGSDIDMSDNIQIIQRSKCIEIQDFIDAGWIVHERVTKFDIDPWENCSSECKFNNPFIGSQACQKCSENRGYNSDEQWIICKLYNKDSK